MSEVQDKVVLITGASSGLGEAAVARSIVFAVEQPADTDVNEMIVRPTAQSL
jgi:NADP-dependent 3-hydroxy acid dehydrogenase YdfG